LLRPHAAAAVGKGFGEVFGACEGIHGVDEGGADVASIDNGRAFSPPISPAPSGIMAANASPRERDCVADERR
jgi:hypothetical protein